MGSIFANTFLVRNGTDTPSLHVVAPLETTLRRKRPHRKSRMGCVRCKRRKVKCDESTPCTNCLKRNETCVPSSFPTPSPTTTSPSSTPSPSSTHPPAISSPIIPPSITPENDLLTLHLLHTFTHHTLPTLIFPQIWTPILSAVLTTSKHTFLLTTILSLSAAHLAYLCPNDARYKRAKHVLLAQALAGYRTALGEKIGGENADALMAGAVVVHYVLWEDLSFLDLNHHHHHDHHHTATDGLESGGDGMVRDGDSMVEDDIMREDDGCNAATTTTQGQRLDLSRDRLYRLSTGQRQIFFMAWKEFQREESVFGRVGILGPCMALEKEVRERGLNWKRYFRGFCELYDGGWDIDDREIWADELGVLTLWESYKEGEAFVEAGGVCDERVVRRAFRRLAERVAIAMAFVEDRTAKSLERDLVGGCWTFGLTEEGLVRYVLTFAMLCFGPLLPLISSGDARMLVLLWHMYRVVGELLPGEKYWWCQNRVRVMGRLIKKELDIRGVSVDLWRENHA